VCQVARAPLSNAYDAPLGLRPIEYMESACNRTEMPASRIAGAFPADRHGRTTTHMLDKCRSTYREAGVPTVELSCAPRALVGWTHPCCCMHARGTCSRTTDRQWDGEQAGRKRSKAGSATRQHARFVAVCNPRSASSNGALAGGQVLEQGQDVCGAARRSLGLVSCSRVLLLGLVHASRAPASATGASVTCKRCRRLNVEWLV
jgi:hypothetical protein